MRFAHLNQHGRYRFNRRGPADGRLRRLRPANSARLLASAAADTANKQDGD